MNLSHHAKRILDHVWGPTGSVILHIFIVIILVKFIVFDTTQKAPEIEVVVMDPDAVELDDFEQELDQLEEMEQPDDSIVPDVNVDIEQPPDVEFDQPEPDVDFAALDINTDVKSPLVMRGLFSGRSAGGRSAGLSKFSGRYGKYTEASVVRALEWLKKVQKEDGAWRKDGENGNDPHTIGFTGLALLTFLAHGETPGSEAYGETVQKALKYLTGQQKANGNGEFCLGTSGAKSYAHAIATYSIAEAYGMTKIPELKDALDQGVDIIIRGQQPNGTWDYGYQQTTRQDFSVSGWNLQALKAAKLSHASNPQLLAAISNGVNGIHWMYAGDGKWAYSRKDGKQAIGNKESMAGVGVLSMQLLGHGEEPEARAGLSFLSTMDFVYDKGFGGKAEWGALHGHPPYTWYYVTQAKFHKGGSTWSSWNKKFAPELVKNQDEEGFWQAPEETLGPEAVTEGRLYDTTLCALTLQVYYRFLPTYSKIAVTPEVDETDDDDVVVEII